MDESLQALIEVRDAQPESSISRALLDDLIAAGGRMDFSEFVTNFVSSFIALEGDVRDLRAKVRALTPDE